MCLFTSLYLEHKSKLATGVKCLKVSPGSIVTSYLSRLKTARAIMLRRTGECQLCRPAYTRLIERVRTEERQTGPRCWKKSGGEGAAGSSTARRDLGAFTPSPMTSLFLFIPLLCLPSTSSLPRPITPTSGHREGERSTYYSNSSLRPLSILVTYSSDEKQIVQLILRTRPAL